MGKRRSETRPFTSIPAFSAWLLAALLPLLFAATASADPLEGLTAPVKEATAPVTEAVGAVVEPVTTTAPPPPEGPPAAKAHPPPPVAAAAHHAAEAGTDAVTGAADSVTSATVGASGGAEKATEDVAGMVEKTTSTGTAAVTEAVVGADSTATTAGSNAVQAVRDNPAAGGPGPVRDEATPGISPPVAAAAPVAGEPAGSPASVLRPFVHVWPAIALTLERSLRGFFGRWSRSLLALFEENATGSLAGIGEALPDSAPASASPSTEQPPFSLFSSPSLRPFNLVDGEDVLLALIFFTVLGAATLFTVGAMRRELGLPMFRRRHRFPWMR